MATTGSLLACQTCPSLVAGKPPERGTKFSAQLAPLFEEKANLLRLNPPFWEKSLIIAIRLLKLLGSTAMCSSPSGTVVVGVIVAPTVYGEPEKPGARASPSSGTSTTDLALGSALRWGMMVLNVADRSTGSSLRDCAAARNDPAPRIARSASRPRV